MKHCTDGVCGRCAVPEPVKRMVDAFDEAFLPYDCETSNGHTCHLEKYRPKIKDFLTTHATTLYNDAVREERERIVDELHAHFPVPDMQQAEMWPHDEQVWWSGIGEVMVRLQEIINN